LANSKTIEKATEAKKKHSKTRNFWQNWKIYTRICASQ